MHNSERLQDIKDKVVAIIKAITVFIGIWVFPYVSSSVPKIIYGGSLEKVIKKGLQKKTLFVARSRIELETSGL